MPPRQHFIRAYIAILLIDVALIIVNVLMDCGFHWPFEILDVQLDLKKEANLATWYSSAQLLLTGMVALWIAWLGPAPGGPRLVHRLGWIGIGLLMIGLSADEVAQLHEWTVHRQIAYFGEDLWIIRRLGLGGWLLMLSPFILAAIVGVVYFVHRCLAINRRSRYLALAGLACWIATLVAEYVESRLYEAGKSSGFEGSIEEGCEIIGAALFLIAFLEFLRTHTRTPTTIS